MISIHMIGGLHNQLNLPQKQKMIDVDYAIGFTEALQLCGLERVPDWMAEKVRVTYKGKHYSFNEAVESLKVEPGCSVMLFRVVCGG